MWWYLIVGVTGVSVLGWFVNTIAPDNFTWLTLFFVIVAVTVFSLSRFILKTARRALLVTLAVIIWLLLRLFGLREIYYVILLTLTLISLEILFERS